MAIDDLLNLAKGLLDGWNNGRLKRTLKQTAQVALDRSIEVAELQEKLRQKEDEIRRLKGEKPKPEIKPTSTKELNPSPMKEHRKSTKNDEIAVDESVDLDVPKDDLPKDAKFIGKRRVVVQELEIRRRNIEFWIHRHWSAELGKVIEGALPESFKGHQFGPALRTLSVLQEPRPAREDPPKPRELGHRHWPGDNQREGEDAEEEERRISAPLAAPP
jgi:hypothetical protein